MILCIADVLDADQLRRARQLLSEVDFQDGRATAGWHARTVKRNTQAVAGDPRVARLRQEMDRALRDHTLFEMAVRPARVKPVMFSRYQPGMEYGSHVDDAVMQGGDGTLLRTDVSFTVFLSDPADYEGGELVTDTTAGEQSYKLPAGAAVVYPSSTLHRVNPVNRGERLAAVGWAQSQVRDPQRREILFDLDTARRSLFQREGKSTEFDAISKSLANLMRLWVET